MHVANNHLSIGEFHWGRENLRAEPWGELISPTKTHLGVARGRLRRIEEGEAIHELTKGRQLIRDATHSKPNPFASTPKDILH